MVSRLNTSIYKLYDRNRKLLFIYKWFNSANLNQNTHINKPKLTYNKPLNENLSKPIPNKTAESRSQKTRYLTLCPWGQEVALKVRDVNDKLFLQPLA